MRSKIEQLFDEDNSSEFFAKGYLDYLCELFSKIDTKKISLFIEILLQARNRGSTIFFVGNGGSASTASHFANDIALGTKSLSKPFKAISLCDNISIITAIGNDFGYDQIFIRQLKNMMQPKDVLVAISVSGNSPNVIKAVEYANSNEGITVGLTGFNGGRLNKIAQMSIHVPSNKGEYGPVEDIHMIIDHLTSAYLMNILKTE